MNRDNMWKILNHDASGPQQPPPNRNNAPLQPIPQKPYYEPPKANPILESIEQTAARARQQAQRPFLEPLSGPLPADDDRALVPARAYQDDGPRRHGHSMGIGLPQMVDMEQRLAFCERAAKLLPLIDQKLSTLERRQDMEGASSSDIVRGMQSYVDKLERRVADMQSIMARALGEFNELKVRDDNLSRELSEAKVYIKRLEGMITSETSVQLQELRMRDERNVSVREEGRKQQMMLQDEVLSLGRELESMRAGMGGMQAEIQSQIQRVASRVDQNEGFMAKIRETEVESIQNSSATFGRLRSEIMQVQSNVQMLEKSIGDTMMLFRSDGERFAGRVREVESILQQTESSAVRKAVAVAEGWFKDLQRTMAEVSDAAKTQGQAVLQDVDSRLQSIDRVLARERQVFSDRIVGLEKNMREVLGLQQVSEESLRRKLELSAVELSHVLDDTRRIVDEKEGKLRAEMDGMGKKMKGYARELEERFERDQRQLEEVIKAEIKARMASYEKVQRLTNRFTGEFQVKLTQAEKRLKDHTQSQVDRVREEVSNLAVEHVLEETMLREEIVDSLQALEKDMFDEVKALSEETRDVFTSLSDQTRDLGVRMADLRVEVTQSVQTELSSLSSRIATEMVERTQEISEVRRELQEGISDEAKERAHQAMGLRSDLTNIERKITNADADLASAVKNIGDAVQNLDYNVGDLQVRATAAEKGISNLNKVDHDLHKALTETRQTIDQYSVFFKDFLRISEMDRLSEIVPPDTEQDDGIPSMVESMLELHRRIEDVRTTLRANAGVRSVTEPQVLRMMDDQKNKIMLELLKESASIVSPMLEAARQSDKKDLIASLEERIKKHLEVDHVVWPPANPGAPPPAGPSPYAAAGYGAAAGLAAGAAAGAAVAAASAPPPPPPPPAAAPPAAPPAPPAPPPPPPAPPAEEDEYGDDFGDEPAAPPAPAPAPAAKDPPPPAEEDDWADDAAPASAAPAVPPAANSPAKAGDDYGDDWDDGDAPAAPPKAAQAPAAEDDDWDTPAPAAAQTKPAAPPKAAPPPAADDDEW